MLTVTIVTQKVALTIFIMLCFNPGSEKDKEMQTLLSAEYRYTCCYIEVRHLDRLNYTMALFDNLYLPYSGSKIRRRK